MYNVRHYINIQMLAVSELCPDIIVSSVVTWSLLATLFVTTPAIDWAGDQCSVQTREQTIWEILEFCYKNQILGLIYRIRADAHGILFFTCWNHMDAEAD